MRKVLIMLLFWCLMDQGFSLTPAPEDLSRYIDSLVQTGIEKEQIPGTIVSIVSPDSIYLVKGYGWSDLENRRKTDGGHSLFQLGSIGKLLTAIAVLQQVEAGKLDLHANVNQYLDNWKIENPFETPLTLFHLLTHSGGLNDRNIGYKAENNEEIEPLGKHLEKRMPSLFQAPGINVNYSNYGYGLAGHLVEKASGMEFTEYIQTNILDPLGMDMTTYYLPDDYRDREAYATGYQTRRSFVEVTNYPRHVIPAGSLLSTARDMSKLMQELLKQEKLLRPRSYEQMLSRQFSNHPLLPGYTFGFEEQLIKGHYVPAKGGRVSGFLSGFVVIPGAETSIFFATNTETDNFATQFWDSVFDFIYSGYADNKPTDTPLELNIEPARYTGNYRNEKGSHDTLEELFTLMIGKITVNREGTNNLRLINSHVRKYRLFSGKVFFNQWNPGDRIAFDSANKKATHLYKSQLIGGLGIPASYSKIPWYEDPQLISAVYPFIFIIILLYPLLFLFWLLIKIFTRHNSSWKEKTRIHGMVYHAIALGFLVLLLADIGFFFFPLINDIRSGDILFGLNDYYAFFRILHIALLLLGSALIFSTVKIWGEKKAWIITRVYHTLYMISGLSFLFLLFHWHFFWVKY